MKATYNFICRRCSALVCEDCRQIAKEWAELAQARARSLFSAEEEMKRLRQELDLAKRRADDFEQMMKLGQNTLLLAWINDKGPAEAIRKMRALKERII